MVSTICTIPKPRFIDIVNNQFALVSSGDSKIYKIQLEDNKVEHFAGKGGRGNVDGTATECQFNFPGSVVVDGSNNVCYLVDQGNHTIRRITVV